MRKIQFMEYLSRTADPILHLLLDAFGAVLIEGPKWCGKTTTAEQMAKSVIKLQDPDMQEDYLVTAQSKPSLLLNGETPRLIDEWQDIPVLWDSVRTMVDKRSKPGQFILTGSNTVPQDKIKHSGTGRIATLRMLPMSLWESKESSGQVSISELFNNADYDFDGATSKLSIEDLIFAACRGGWPASLNGNTPAAQLLVARNYINSVCAKDISRIDGKNRDEKLSRQILKSYARNISTLAKKTSILEDITASKDINCSIPTLDDYITALERLFVIQDIEAWCPAIRSKTTIDLDSQISYYRDRYGLEADIVLHLPDGRYALIECKLGSMEIEKGAEHLLKIKELIREKNKAEKQMPIREPDLQIILTGGTMAYTRNDGVKVIPLAALKP